MLVSNLKIGTMLSNHPDALREQIQKKRQKKQGQEIRMRREILLEKPVRELKEIVTESEHAEDAVGLLEKSEYIQFILDRNLLKYA